jgi:hypothetical protein
MKKIEEIRRWMDACDKAGIGDQIPEQLRLMDAYARLLEANLMAFNPVAQ